MAPTPRIPYTVHRPIPCNPPTTCSSYCVCQRAAFDLQSTSMEFCVQLQVGSVLHVADWAASTHFPGRRKMEASLSVEVGFRGDSLLAAGGPASVRGPRCLECSGSGSWWSSAQVQEVESECEFGRSYCGLVSSRLSLDRPVEVSYRGEQGCFGVHMTRAWRFAIAGFAPRCYSESTYVRPRSLLPARELVSVNQRYVA